MEVAHTSRFPLTNKTITSASISSQQSDSIEFIVSHGPKLLQPILADAILTGKSMEMLENLGRISEVQDTSLGVFERPPSLFELFVSDLRAKLGEKTHSKHPSSESASGKISTKITHGDGLLTKLLQMKGVKDSLLTINSASLMSHCKIPADKNKTDRSVPDGKCGLSPLLRICESCLYPHMRARYQTVCIKLVHILKTEYHLISCIQAMQRYYLMSSGEIMYDFYTQIFHKMSKKEEWREASLLEMYLHEAVTPRYPSDVSRLSVVVKSPSSFHDKSPISATDCINLNYNVPWPLNVVISGKCQELYNSIFCFLLQVKRAKYVQDELKFEDLAREQAVARLAHEDDNETMPRHKRIHRCQLFRFRLLYFINSLHNYIMTRILHSTGLEFATQLEGATDLEQIISIHRGYVQAIHERCLLHHKLSVLKEAVMKVLNLSLTFSLLWRQGVDFIHGETILSMETELTRCIHFLAVFLNNVIKRGSFPHCEFLS
ncbi:unnamed protein product [Lymnaea stagnalis]|uniref:Gamma-tubulin complex component n=1 Tax=Lymnaea stagnalis TaxID=6523 RepID=A0AAV2HVF7_LYMST